MPETSVVKFSYIQSEQRLDAEYYKQSFLDIVSALGNCDTMILRNGVEDVIGGPFGSTVVVSQYTAKGIPFLRVANIKDMFIDTSDLVYVDVSKRNSLKRFILKPNDIVSSRVGTIGLFSVLSDDYPEWCLGSNLIAVTNICGFKPYFLLAFLNSKFGKMQILRPVSGQVQEKITTENMKNILVPLLPKKFQVDIHKKMTQAYQKRKLAYEKYATAEHLLYSFLGIKQEEINALELCKLYSVNFTELVQSCRLDAEYYHPKFLGINQLLKKSPCDLKPVKEMSSISEETINPSKEPFKQRIFKYVPIAKIAETGEIFEWDEYFGWALPNRARMLIKENNILVPSMGGTFGKIALVPKELNNALTTTGCFVLRADNAIPEFLFLYFRSQLFRRQLEQHVTGGIMSSVPKGGLDNLIVPNLPMGTQLEIALLIKEFISLRKEHRNMITSAIGETEKAIEGVTRNGTVGYQS
jgi:restriction endonuclease S subunit